MSLATRLQDLTTRVATEFKTAYGRIGTLANLTTTAKGSLVDAVNEVNAKPSGGGGATSLDQLSDVAVSAPATGHVLRHDGTQFVNTPGSSWFDVAGAAAAAQAASQPLDADLTAIAALTTTPYGRALLALADTAALMGLVPAATEAVQGKVELATAAETTAGTDGARAVTPAGLKVELDKKASTASLGYFATGTDAGNLTGTLPSSVLPPLAVTKVNVVGSQAAMLALTAEEGDVAKRTDNGRTYFLAASPASTLSNWVEVTSAGDVTSVAGKVGAVTLVKGDVGLGNVDNTSDAAKPVSTATQTALNAKQGLDATLTALAALTTAANQFIMASGPDTFAMVSSGATGRSLLAAADAAAARGTLSVYSQAEIGNPEQDLVAVFEAGLA
jgi:hypothetical protein